MHTVFSTPAATAMGPMAACATPVFSPDDGDDFVEPQPATTRQANAICARSDILIIRRLSTRLAQRAPGREAPMPRVARRNRQGMPGPGRIRVGIVRAQRRSAPIFAYHTPAMTA